MSDMRFPYQPKFVILSLSVVFFVLCGVLLGNVALTNDKGLILNGIVEFSTEGATTFYWWLVFGSGLFVVLGSIIVLSGLMKKREIVLTETQISAPKNGLSSKIVAVTFSNIVDVSILAVQGQEFLNIQHRDGKLVIPRNMLPTKQAFEELAGSLVTRVNSQRDAA